MNIITKITEIAAKSNFLESGYIDVVNLKYYPEVRAICEDNMCRNYAASWACPPAIGTITECRERVSKYDILSDFLLLSNEGCGRCPECTYPTAPCRFPDLLHHSLEGYGFIVNELAAEAGIHYNNGMNTVTYFGALLFKK